MQKIVNIHDIYILKWKSRPISENKTENLFQRFSISNQNKKKQERSTVFPTQIKKIIKHTNDMFMETFGM